MNEAPSNASSASKTRKRFPWVKALALVLCVPVLFIGNFVAASLIAIHKADSGFRKAKQTIRPEEIRAWALEAIKNYPATNGYSITIPKSEIPSYLKNLYTTSPENAWVSPKTGDSEGCVMIMWGGGFFHWGMNIGPTNFVPRTNHQYPKAFMLSPGIYYLRETSWGLL
ncbi:MAG: hypothetical protein HOP33_10955 [Verrucomicrobia bacterium]|nr:hypothetical protein [Verrucomicrobiota bacterium]